MESEKSDIISLSAFLANSFRYLQNNLSWNEKNIHSVGRLVNTENFVPLLLITFYGVKKK